MWDFNPAEPHMQAKTTTIDHPLIFMHFSEIYGHQIMGFQDWMHCSGFRIRRLLLDGVHNFHLADGGDAGVAYLRRMLGSHFSAKDLDYKEKQHWSGCLKIFHPTTLKHLKEKILPTDPHARGVIAYIQFGIKLLNVHLGQGAGANQAPSTDVGAVSIDRFQAVTDAAYCCAFVLYWRCRG